MCSSITDQQEAGEPRWCSCVSVRGEQREVFVNTFWPRSSPSSCSQRVYMIHFTSTELSETNGFKTESDLRSDRLPRGDAKYISLTLQAKHCHTEPSADINVNRGAPLSPRMSTFAHAIWSKGHLLTLLQAPGCRGSHGRKWPTADGLSIPWAPGASINHQKQELTFPAREDDVPSSLIFLMTFRVKSALHYKSGANGGDLPLKQSFTLLPIKRFVAPSLWKRFSCQMIVIHGIMQILQGNMRSSNTAHTLAINRRNWWGADGRWSCLHRTIFCHLWV